tara:strand:+ start:34 stop:654 length:621 start_codon:yes stop_codon:yes gene_type:complete
MDDSFSLHEGHALDLIDNFDKKLDLVVTDPPYALTGSGAEHAVSSAVACVLRETAKKLATGSWMVVFSASSWRSISYMTESVRGILSPVRVANWVKPKAHTAVRTPGWSWTTVTLIAMRKGKRNNPELVAPPNINDWLECAPMTKTRRAQLPPQVAEWAVAPYIVPGGVFLDPFAGSGALPAAAARLGMNAHGFEINPPNQEKTDG